MENSKKKMFGLLKKFTLIFMVFVFATIAVTATFMYFNQSRLYNERYVSELEKANDFLESEIQGEIDDFAYLVEWFDAHKDELLLPYDYPESVNAYRDEFERTFIQNYPGQIFGKDVVFRELDDDTKLAYARYLYLKWITEFDRIRDVNGFDYVYFVYDTGGDYTMSYMFDALRETTKIDGKEYLLVGFEAYEDPEIHENMWRVSSTGEKTAKVDVTDNEFGNVYTLCTPIVYESRVVGVLCSDISVGFVTGEINTNVRRLSTLVGIILLICTFVMLFVVNIFVLQRVAQLNKDINIYSNTKNSDISAKIRDKVTGNDEITSLNVSFADMIDSLQEYMDNLTKVTAEKERIGAELSVATNIQASMLPRIFPAFPEREEFDLFASMSPAKEVGGDLYDFFFVDESHLALVIADVSGKGVPAALFMAISKAMIKDRSMMDHNPASILTNVNNLLCEGNDEMLFVTTWVGILDLKTGEVVCADAGHEYPIILKENGEVEVVEIAQKKLPMGAMENMEYVNESFKLSVGDTLYLYTDGVPEATNGNSELYDMERLEKIIGKCKGMSPQDIDRAVREDVDKFVGDADQFDDMTMLCVKLNKLL